MSLAPPRHWLREVTPAQWFVVTVASAAWFFDTLDQRLFSLARVYALASLSGHAPGDLDVQAAAKVATSIMLLGWGVGGLVSGALGDRYGHARFLTLSILLYAIGSALSAACGSVDQFVAARLLTGIGIGGVFGLAVAMIADTVKGEARLAFLAGLQIVASFANMASSFIKMAVDHALGPQAVQASGWRVIFAVSAAPILLGLVCLIWLRETEAWRGRRASAGTGMMAAVATLWRDPVERRHLWVGTVMATAGVVGLWGVGEFATDLQTAVFATYYARLVPAAQATLDVADARNWAFFLQMIGGTAGIVAFGATARRWGRRPAFLVWFLAAFAITVGAYGTMTTPADAYWMMPLMGAAQLGLFGGFSIYLPELFGAATRGTGVSIAYNLGRFGAAAGGIISTYLATRVFAGFAAPLPLRYSAMAMCAIFLIGAAATLVAPETKGAEFRD